MNSIIYTEAIIGFQTEEICNTGWVEQITEDVMTKREATLQKGETFPLLTMKTGSQIVLWVIICEVAVATYGVMHVISIRPILLADGLSPFHATVGTIVYWYIMVHLLGGQLFGSIYREGDPTLGFSALVWQIGLVLQFVYLGFIFGLEIFTDSFIPPFELSNEWDEWDYSENA